MTRPHGVFLGMFDDFSGLAREVALLALWCGLAPHKGGGLAPLIGRADIRRAAMGNEVSSAEDPHEPVTRAGAAQLPISLNTRCGLQLLVS